MKIAVPATSHPKVDLNNFDEINIRCTANHTAEQLVKFCSNFQEKRINISFDESVDLVTVVSAKELLGDNLYVRLSFNQIEERYTLENYNVKYFFDCYIDSYIKLRYFLYKTKTTDIYISDDLCYNLEEVFLKCKEVGVAIRMVLNKIPSTFKYAGVMYDAPIFRPQDFEMLDKYITTAEFDCFKDDRYAWNEFEVLYRRWFKHQTWKEDLNYINKDLEFDFPNDLVPNGYNLFRSNCRHRCMMRQNWPCSKCSRFISLGQNLSQYKKDPE